MAMKKTGYHPNYAKRAMEAYEKRKAQKEVARERKADQRKGKHQRRTREK
jgi:hypothetical protein